MRRFTLTTNEEGEPMYVMQRPNGQPAQQPMSPKELAQKAQELEDLSRQQKWAEAARKYFEIPQDKRAQIIKQLMDKYEPLAKRLEQLPDTNTGKPYDLHFGTIAHDVIAGRYREFHRGETIITNGKHVKTMAAEILNRPNLPDNGADRVKTPPDITNLTTRELYEIKPKEHAAQGRAQRDGYIAAFLSYGVKISPGKSSDPGANGMTGSEGGFVVYHSPEPGLILYERREKRQPVGAAVPVPAPATNEREDTPLGKAAVLVMLAFFAWLLTLPARFAPALQNIPIFKPPTLDTADAGGEHEPVDT